MNNLDKEWKTGSFQKFVFRGVFFTVKRDSLWIHVTNDLIENFFEPYSLVEPLVSIVTVIRMSVSLSAIRTIRIYPDIRKLKTSPNYYELLPQARLNNSLWLTSVWLELSSGINYFAITRRCGIRFDGNMKVLIR